MWVIYSTQSQQYGQTCATMTVIVKCESSITGAVVASLCVVTILITPGIANATLKHVC